MKRRRLFTLVFALLMGMSLPAAALDVGIRGYYWYPGLSGDIKVDGAGITGTTLDLENDLGIEDKSYPIIEIFSGLGNHHFSFSYYNVNYGGSRILSKTVNFRGLTFAANTLVNSNLEYDVYDFMYQYDLLDMENILAGFSLGLVGKVKVLDGSVSLNSTALSTNHDFTIPIPMLGLNLHMGILADILEARLLATGIGFSKGTVFDGLAEISYTPFPLLDIHGGYRFFDINIDTKDVAANYKTSGPYAALTISF